MLSFIHNKSYPIFTSQCGIMIIMHSVETMSQSSEYNIICTCTVLSKMYVYVIMISDFPQVTSSTMASSLSRDCMTGVVFDSLYLVEEVVLLTCVLMSTALLCLNVPYCLRGGLGHFLPLLFGVAFVLL